MAENVFVEIFNEGSSDKGTGEIVITDLNNKLMPLIRYRLKDLSGIMPQDCACGRGLPILGRVMGRTQAQYIRTSEGEMIHSVIFAYFFETLTTRGIGIKKFRIVQEDLHHLQIYVRLERYDSSVVQQVLKYLKKEIEPILSDKINYSVEFTKDFEISNNHKFSFFESRLKEP